MNISKLTYFVTTAQQGSYALAAKKLYVSPQAISKAINEMERELNVQLITKKGRGIEITPFGRVFEARASEVIQSFCELRAYAKNQGEGPSGAGFLRVAIASTTYRGEFIARSALTAFEAAYPKIELEYSYNFSGACLASLEEGFVDCAIILGTTEKPGSVCQEIYSFSPLLLVSKDHPLAEKEEVALTDLGDYTVAAPVDIRYCFPKSEALAKRMGIAINYRELRLFLDDHIEFLNNQGVMFTSQDKRLTKLYPSAVLVPLERHQETQVPVCFVSREEAMNDMVTCFGKSLRKSYKKGILPMGSNANPSLLR